MKRFKHFGLLVLIWAPALWSADTGPGEIKKVEVFPSAEEVRVEITLSVAVVPEVETAQNPDRLVVKLPGTTSDPLQKRIPVRQSGVRTIRFGLNRPNPPETHLVVDLNEEHPYKITTEGDKIILVIQPSVREEARKRNAPAAAASKPLISSLGSGSQRTGTLNSQNTSGGELLTPPPSGPPIQFPQVSPQPNSPATTTTASSAPPSARHPNFGSLQQGTVFPGTGTPGTGEVPRVSGLPRDNSAEHTSSAEPLTTADAVPASTPPQPSSSTADTGTNSASVTPTPPLSKSEQPTLKAENTSVTEQSAAANAAQATPRPQSLPAAAASTQGETTARTAPVPSPVKSEKSTSSSQSNTVAQSATAASSSPVSTPVQAGSSSATNAPTSTNVSAAQVPAELQVVSREPNSNPRSNAATESSLTASTAQGSTSPRPVPQEPAPSVNPLLEVAAPVPQASETSLPASSGQAPADEKAEQEATASVETTPTEEAREDVPANGHLPQIVRRVGENSDFRTAFRVKFVAQDTAYLDGGRAVGLAEGMKLVVRDLPNAGGVATAGANSDAAGDVAELNVLSVAENSAVTEIHESKRPLKAGDLAYLSAADQQALVEKTALSASRKYPVVVSFSEDDTIEEELRASIPKPPSPAVNRSRGRIGLSYLGVLNPGVSNIYTHELGLVVRTDITRIGGTYWNVSGYWNGRFEHTTNSGPQTLQDLINRTYHLYTSYDNPNSSWVAGFGRMYLPWATSLDTIDGGYTGRKFGQGATAGIFLGSTPDPTSWGYAPNRQIGGLFINFSGGSYDDFHYTSTSGAGMNMLSWAPDRPFIFFENGLYYKRILSIYQASQIDSLSAETYTYQCPTCAGGTGTFTQAGADWGLGRNFVTVRFSPHPRIEFSANDTYYRDLPYLDPSSITSAGIAAGLFDKFLAQGIMGGIRVEVLHQIWLNADLGTNRRSGDNKDSLNQMFGITFGHVPWINAHLDARYNRFNSSFGSGHYEALSLTRNLSEGLQLQVLAGQQNFSSTLTSADQARFVNAMIESNLGRRYFIQAGGTINRGKQMSYDQWLFTFGYRFDNRQGQKVK